MKTISVWLFVAGIATLGFRGQAVEMAGGPSDTEAELQALSRKVPRFKVLDLPATGDVALKPEQGLTVDDLRGVDLDENPPLLATPAKPYDPRMADDLAAGTTPAYVAREIRPFRYRFFNCEFNYGGWHNFTMTDYAATRGFNILYPYIRTPGERAHLPAGTQWLSWGGHIDWQKWLPEHGINDGRYDRLTEIGLLDKLVAAAVFKPDPASQFLMIDMEHGFLAPAELRQQEWYPKTAPEPERQAFERKYYEGYALTYAVPVAAAHQAGWKNVSVYGWAPFSRRYWGLDKVIVEPQTDFDWNAYGRRIYEAVDILNPSVYCFYWTPQNVAYVLANIDLNLRFVNAMAQRKAVRPYFWTLLHGGGGGSRWWANQPLPNEEVRAMVALAFFAGIDGFDCWNWSGTGSHQVPPEPTPGTDVMLRDGFDLAADDGVRTAFQRYDVLHILTADPQANTVRFQRIDKKDSATSGLTEDKPKYTMRKPDLVRHLHPAAEAVAGMVEGMALVKPFEWTLRHGAVKVDVPAPEQFGKTLPIVRRVKCDRVHILATYDPTCVYGGTAREIVLTDFDGVAGLTLRLPADSQTRVFVVRR